jgi:hypothetical protein
MEIPEPPKKFNWRAVKAWLNIVREANLTNRTIAGRNITKTEQPGQGTVTNADDCTPCP